MMKTGLLFIFLTLILSICYSQKELIDISAHGDCKSALKIETDQDFGPTTAPTGHGKILEFKDNPKTSLYYFEREHNTVWYKFITPFDGDLVIQIIPVEIKDDYDFLLYKIDQPNYCTKIINKQVKPIRSNIARNDYRVDSKTGLSRSANIMFKDAGPGPSFSKSLQVSKGELYYLAVDNVYNNGKGHIIYFDYLKENGESAITRNIKGIVTEEETNKPLKAKVFLEDVETGEVLAQVETDANGKYEFKMPKDFDMSKKYNISVTASGHFFKDAEIVPQNFKNETIKSTKVQKLKEGKSISITNISFYKDSPQYLPGAEKVLEKIVKMMRKNPEICIEIEGHIDGCKGTEDSRRILSEGRAETIKRYLTDHDIDACRITTKGYGCTKMIFPKPKNEKEHKENRRVEIKITQA